VVLLEDFPWVDFLLPDRPALVVEVMSTLLLFNLSPLSALSLLWIVLSHALDLASVMTSLALLKKRNPDHLPQLFPDLPRQTALRSFCSVVC